MREHAARSDLNDRSSYRRMLCLILGTQGARGQFEGREMGTKIQLVPVRTPTVNRPESAVRVFAQFSYHVSRHLWKADSSHAIAIRIEHQRIQRHKVWSGKVPP